MASTLKQKLMSIQKKNFQLNRSESAEENFERFIEVFNHNRILWPVEADASHISAIKGYWPKLNDEEKWKFLEVCTETETDFPVGVSDGSGSFKKATDTNLEDAVKFINKSNTARLATRFLGLTSQQIIGRDVFAVLKLWRDAMPFQGSKEDLYSIMRRASDEGIVKKEDFKVYSLFYNVP